jgi:hypothetical protein
MNDVIPEFDGTPEKLAEWVRTIDRLRSMGLDDQGALTRALWHFLKDDAKEWWDQHDAAQRNIMANSWHALRVRLSRFFWTPIWVTNARSKALAAKYRDNHNHRETPVQFVLRKRKLIDIVEDWQDVDIIAEVARSAPTQWRTIVNHEEIADWATYLTRIKEQEDLLHDWPRSHNSHHNTHDTVKEVMKAIKAEKKARHTHKASVHNVNSDNKFKGKQSDKFKGYRRPFKPDDSNVTKHAKGTPKSRGMRGCIHCGSKMHYDKECKHQKNNSTNVQAYFVDAGDEEQSAYAEYEAYYEDASSESQPSSEEEKSSSSDSSSESDFF